MTPERSEVVREVLAAVVAAPPGRRVALLDAACDSDPALRQDLEQLLPLHSTLERLAALPSAPTLAAVLRSGDLPVFTVPHTRLAPGTHIGPYLVERLLGVGGMGEVYLAQDTRLLRRVALKCVARRIADDPVVRARALREARAAARLTHPGIAHLNDVLDHDGTIVIVMEYVDGRSLATRLAEGPCSVDEAVELAFLVADALEHAHAAGIIHCDVKPGNIQLTGNRTLKILDFGIARSLLPDAAEITSTSAAAPVFAGTPGYMSPEQALGLPVDARSDVFSLGVVLFEMLTGQRPFDTGYRHLEPFHVVLADPPDLATLAPHVPRALRAVVARALDRHVERRYQTAGELRDALRQALPPTATTAEKEPTRAAARRWAWAIASAAVGLALVGVTTWRVATAPAPLAIAPQAEGWYLEGVDALQEGAYVHARRSLERAVQIDPAFPLAWARLGEAHLELDQEPLAVQALLKASSLVPNRARLPSDQRLSLEAAIAMGSRDAATALKAYSALAATQRASAPLFLDLGRAQEALDDSGRALEHYERAAQLDASNPAPFLRMGVLYSRLGDAGKASKAFDRAEELYEMRNRAEGVAAVSLQRGVMLARLDRSSEALSVLGRALQLAESVDSRHLRAEALFRMSSVEGALGQYADAEAKAREALELSEGLDGLRAFGLVDLGTIYLSAGREQDAEQQFRRAVEQARAAGARRPEARGRLALGDLLIRTGRVDEGMAEAQAALAYYEQTGFRSLRSSALLILARGHERTGDLSQAQASYEALLNTARTPSEAADPHYLLCGVLLLREQYVSALRHCDDSLEVFTKLGFPYDVAYGVLRRTDVLARLGRLDEADRELEAMFRAGSPTGDSTEALERVRHLRRAKVALVRGEHAAAIRIARTALSASGQIPAESTARLHVVLALALARRGAPSETWPHVEAAQRAAAASGGEVLRADTELARAEVLVRLGRYAEAFPAAAKLAEQLVEQQRHESAWTASALAARAAARLKRPDDAERWRRFSDEARAKFVTQFDPEALRLYESRPDLKAF